MSAGPSLKVVSTFSAGYDHIATDELAKRNITLGSGTLHTIKLLAGIGTSLTGC